jgi:hypothetical protein
MTSTSFTPSDLSLAETFAVRRTATSFGIYSSRGESRPSKINEDTIVGALGEICFHRVYSNIDPSLSSPDFTLYTKERKSFSADLKSDSFDFHVKSQSLESSQRHGISWLFQKSDPLYRRPTPRDWLVFCIVDMGRHQVNFLGFASAVDIKEKDAWGIPNSPKYRDTKVALYFDMLEELGLVRI